MVHLSDCSDRDETAAHSLNTTAGQQRVWLIGHQHAHPDLPQPQHRLLASASRCREGNDARASTTTKRGFAGISRGPAKIGLSEALVLRPAISVDVGPMARDVLAQDPYQAAEHPQERVP